MGNIVHGMLVCCICLLVGCSEQTPTNSVSTENDQTLSQNRPDFTTDTMQKVVNHMNNGKLEEAKKLLEERIQQEPSNGTYYFYLGNVYRKMNDYPNALTNYETALTKDVGIKEAYNNAAAIRMMRKEYAEALKILDEGLKHHADFLDLKFKKGQVLYAMRHFEQSIQVLKEVSTTPAFFEAHRYIGLCYIQLDDKEQAVHHLNEYLKIAPQGVPAREAVQKLIKQIKGE